MVGDAAETVDREQRRDRRSLARCTKAAGVAELSSRRRNARARFDRRGIAPQGDGRTGQEQAQPYELEYSVQ